MGEGGGARLAGVIEVIDDIMLGARDVTQRGSLFQASVIGRMLIQSVSMSDERAISMIAASRHRANATEKYIATQQLTVTQRAGKMDTAGTSM